MHYSINISLSVSTAKGRIEKLREDNGITASPRYTNPEQVEVRIVSPQVAQFVALLQNMDELMIALDALWLYGVLSNKQRSDGVYTMAATAAAPRPAHRGDRTPGKGVGRKAR